MTDQEMANREGEAARIDAVPDGARQLPLMGAPGR